MIARRLLRAALRTIKRLARRVFWRHQWKHVGTEFDRRICTVCGQVEAPAGDGWHSGWDVLINGEKSRHWTSK